MVKKLLLFALVLFAVPALIHADVTDGGPGTIGITWDEVTTDLNENPVTPDGYKVYYGSVPRGTAVPPDGYALTQTVTGATNTSYLITNLPDCEDVYIAVTAFKLINPGTTNELENESQNYSLEINGWTRPRIEAVTPSSLPQGFVGDVVLNGFSFGANALGDISSVDGGPANTVVINDTVVDNACNQLTLNVTVPLDEPLGERELSVINQDDGGTYAAAFNVTITDSAAPQEPTGLRRTENSPAP